MAFPIIQCTGSPYELGFQHGSQAKDLVRQSVEAYKHIFHDLAGHDWPTVLKLAKGFEPKLTAAHPDLMEEIKGVADGAEVEPLSVLALNVRSEISLISPLDGCTSFSRASHRPDPQLFICQNWDWKTVITKSIIILDLKPIQGPAIQCVTEAGIIGKIGFNSAGVAVVMNAIKSPSMNSDFLPVHLLMRRLLQQTSLRDCRAYLDKQGGCASAVHLMLADRTGAVSVECAPQGFVYLTPDSHSVLCHTNHFLDKSIKAKSGEGDWLPDSKPRYDLMHKTLAQAEQLSHKKNFELLGDRTLGVHGICRHEGGTGIDTLFSISIDVNGKEAQVKQGKPDEHGAISVLAF